MPVDGEVLWLCGRCKMDVEKCDHENLRNSKEIQGVGNPLDLLEIS